MKHNILTTVIAAVALLAIGCTREEVTPAPAPTTVVRNVNYIVCGESATATVTGEAEWHALLDSLFDAVDGGCELTFWDAAAAQQQAKETVTYTTASRDSAFAWGEKMYDEGYTISVIFDPQTGRYNCSAVKTNSAPERQYRNVGVSVCGYLNPWGHRVDSDTAWIHLLDALFDSIDEGCVVAIWNNGYIPDTNQAKTAISYRTALRDSAYTWIDTMFNRNYCITVFFDPVDLVYSLTATELANSPIPLGYPDYYPSLHCDLLIGLQLAVDEDVPLVINSQEQFDSLLPYSFLPRYIDFNTQTLICAWGGSPNGIYSLETSIEHDGNDVIVTVDIKMTMLFYSPNWFIFLPCDKITDDQNVSLVVNRIPYPWD